MRKPYERKYTKERWQEIDLWRHENLASDAATERHFELAGTGLSYVRAVARRMGWPILPTGIARNGKLTKTAKAKQAALPVVKKVSRQPKRAPSQAETELEIELPVSAKQELAAVVIVPMSKIQHILGGLF